MPMMRQAAPVRWLLLLVTAAAAPAIAQEAVEALPPPAPPAPATDSGPTNTAPPPNEDDPRIDAATGRDVRTWPPDRPFDHLHIRLEMDVPDMTTPKFSGVATITLIPIGVPRSSLVLDAGPGLTFTSADLDGRPVRFTHDKEAHRLLVEFDRPVPLGKTVDLRLVYTADEPGGRGEGLTWSRDDDRTPEFDWLFHAQGQPQSNHLWFPCHDFPNERLTSEIIITVPAPYEAVSNGRLVSVRRNPAAVVPPPANLPEPDSAGVTPALPPDTGTVTFHWRQDKTHAPYLITLVVGRFDVVNLGGPGSPTPGLSVPVYGPIGSSEALRHAFANTPEMIRHFAELFDFPYPWDQYAQILCRDFAAGAMENTSATTFHAGMARGGGRRGQIDDIIAHEIVHQWFGDLVGYRAWEHLWLGEGWATFGEALWAEKLHGEDGYQEAMLSNFNSERTSARRRHWPRHGGMVSNRYKNPDSRFFGGDNVYQKGGAVLHMLRMRLGDEVFWKGAREYLKRHAYQQVETDDFRIVMEEVSGQSLERFFDQWCNRPGHPHLEVDFRWSDSDNPDDGAGTLTVTVEQVQRIDADNPAYTFVLPIYVRFGDEEEDENADHRGQYVHITCAQRVTKASFILPEKPSGLSVDPHLTVLCRKKVRQGLNAALDQLRHGPTYAAKLDAIQTLRDIGGPRALGALLEAGIDLNSRAALAAAARSAAADVALQLPSRAGRTTVHLARAALNQANRVDAHAARP